MIRTGGEARAKRDGREIEVLIERDGIVRVEVGAEIERGGTAEAEVGAGKGYEAGVQCFWGRR